MPRAVGLFYRQVLGAVLGLVARAWLATLRVSVSVHPALADVADKPWVLTFFHGTQWPILAWRGRRRTVALVSFSLDGAVQARALGALGLEVERGSSSRGGVRGLIRMARRLRAGGLDAAFAVDGPRGPYGIVKGGARVAARAADAVLVPVGSAFARGIVLDRAWDRFGIAWPFTRVAVCLGMPSSPRERSGDHGLAIAIASANDEAARALGAAARHHDASGPVTRFGVASRG